MAIDWTGGELGAALRLLEAQLDAGREEQGIPGLSAALCYDQDMVWAKGFGYADLEKKIPADSGSIYLLSSITKLFTDTMLMQLRNAGKLHLDDPVERYLPAFKVKSRFPDARPPTFRQVVSHMSGLPREAPLDYRDTLKFPSIEALLESLADTEMVFPAMTEFKYSNLGIAMVGHALELIADQPYKDYVAEHILKPLGMTRSGFDVSDEMRPHMVTGYLTAKGMQPRPAPVLGTGAWAPVGRLLSSVEDLSHFICLQFRDGAAGGAQVLGGTTLREMHQPVFMDPDGIEGTGIGWRLGRISGHSTIGHDGSNPGFTTNVTAVPGLKLGIAVFTNTSSDPSALARSALAMLIPIVSRALSRQDTAEVGAAPVDAQKYIGRYYSRGVPTYEVKLANGRLVLVSLATRPTPETILIREGENKFRMKGGSASGELAVFELDAVGNVARVKFAASTFERQ